MKARMLHATGRLFGVESGRVNFGREIFFHFPVDTAGTLLLTCSPVIDLFKQRPSFETPLLVWFYTMKTLRALLFLLPAAVFSGATAFATPYASCFSNNLDGTMSFYLNESGANVTIVYEDGSTNANFNGVSTGTNLTLGKYSFDLGTHTSYSISCYKLGSGFPSLISSHSFTPRGVAVNNHTNSPYFGRVYGDVSGGGIDVMNPDLTLTFGGARSAGVSWVGNGFSPYRLFVGDDDYLYVGDGSAGNAGAYRIDPNVTTNTVIFGPGESAGLATGTFGTVQSKPLIVGNPTNGPFTLLQIDGDYDLNGTPYNSLLVYSNLSLSSLPYTNPPTFIGPAIGVDFNSALLGGNSYPGLVVGPHGYVYCSTYRNNLSNPLIQIYDPANGYAQVWNSQENAPASGDWFLTTQAGITQGIIDCVVSEDGQWLVAPTIDNWFIITPLLPSGIPDTSKIFLSTPTSYTGNGRGIAMDIADNVYLSSSGIGAVQAWSLGFTTTAITQGNTNGATGFQLIEPSNVVSVVATTPVASQGGNNGTAGTAVPGVFTLTRVNAQNDYSSAFTVNYTLSGTASNGVYTVSPTGTPATTNSVTFQPGQQTATVTITPTTDNTPRLTTTVVLTLNGGAEYLASTPRVDTVYIQNTSAQEFGITPTTNSMYKALSNDYAFTTITRYGDTNVTLTIPGSAFSYTGTAVAGTDFTPIPDITFSPGEVTKIGQMFPLIDGQPPVDTNNPVYTGNKSGTVTLAAATGYTVLPADASSFVIVDNAYVPGPATILTDPLTSASDAANWNITFASGDPDDIQQANYKVQFGYDLSGEPESGLNGIGAPPSGASNALFITLDKNQPYAEGGVNAYLTNQVLRGNYAVRFSMNVIQGSSVYNVEGPIFGINHTGSVSNWFANNLIDTNNPQQAWASDGVWFWVDASPGGQASDYLAFTGAGPLPNAGWTEFATAASSTFANVFKNPTVYTAHNPNSPSASGVPANLSTYLASSILQDSDWADVEIKQVQNVVTMSINHTPIFTYSNTNVYTNGYLMLGWECPETGTQHDYNYTPESGAYYSDIKVVELSPEIVKQPANVGVPLGSSATFTAVADYGAPPYTNVWYFGTNAVFTNTSAASPDSAAYTIPSANFTDDGSYTVVVSDSSGSVTSSAATLTVVGGPEFTNTIPSITTNWHVNITIAAGTPTGTAPFSYQWFTNGVALANGGRIGGANTATLSITNLQPSDSAIYQVLATNIAGMASNGMTLTVIIPPAPTITGISLSGTNAILSVTNNDIYDTASSFILQSSTNVAGPYSNVTSVISNAAGGFEITVPLKGPTEFYRVEHK